MSVIRLLVVASVLAAGLPSGDAWAQSTLRVVMHSDLKIVDPIWTTAYIVRNHGYMVYDTLFAMDAKGEYKPQMVDKYDVSADKLTYTFTLRDGLLWHDGKPVTAEDCVASIKRWAAKDSLGQKMFSFVKEMQVVNPKTFKILLKEQTGLVIPALGKPSSNVPFMMPKRVADTDPNTQISDFTGSGPFVFKKEEWKAGDKAVYVKFAQYKPRPEPPSALAGGKVVKVDRVEWRAIPDHQTSANALLAGEVDMIESPLARPAARAQGRPERQAAQSEPARQPVRVPLQYASQAVRQPEGAAGRVVRVQPGGLPQGDRRRSGLYKVCKAMFVCGTPLESTKGMEGLLESNFEKSKALLKEAGYDGTPIVLMQSTDLAVLANLAPVAKNLLEKGGFKVDMQSMDWQTWWPAAPRRIRPRRAAGTPSSPPGWRPTS